MFTPSITETGEYKVRVTVQDDNPSAPAEKTYEFYVIVRPPNTPVMPVDPLAQYAIKDASMANKELKAKIKTISVSGEVKVLFNREVIVPNSYKNFDGKVLILSIKEGKETRKVNFTWNIIDFTPDRMLIKLTFADPASISK